MTHSPSLSIVTLTKNRARLLEKCLISLVGQLTPNDEYVIVDNFSNDNTQAVIANFLRKLPVASYKTHGSGFSRLYNFAISKCTKDIIVFLDDDCGADSKFVATIRKRYTKKKDFVLQGKTKSLPKNNIFAEISEDHLTNWIANNTTRPNMLSVIDNRNVVIPKSILGRVGGFDPAMDVGSEDVELGRRLTGYGVPILYDPQVLAYHHERTSLKQFLMQHMRIAKSHAILDAVSPGEKRISFINTYTWRRHIRSFFSREAFYFREKRYKDACYLPFVYVLLVLARIVGYLTARDVQRQG